jgi:ADP-ribosylglycohydrolase
VIVMVEATASRRERVEGCLLGGAVGDALGAPLEFLSLSEIRAQFGPAGLSDYAPAYGRLGAVTDDTQMTLFTAEGLVLAADALRDGDLEAVLGSVYEAYLRWLETQGGWAPGVGFGRAGGRAGSGGRGRSGGFGGSSGFGRSSGRGGSSGDPVERGEHLERAEPGGRGGSSGWLVGRPELRHRRGPGRTCLSALGSGAMGTIEAPINSSKGCGGIMRVAPVGLIGARDPFRLGCAVAAITHGHPSGYLAAGFQALVLDALVGGASLEEAIESARAELRRWPDHGECLAAVDGAVRLAAEGRATPERVERLGEGWVAEEALAIALYCALTADGSFERGVLAAANHSGDSDSTAAIAGNLLGALLGRGAIPERWLGPLEVREVVERLAGELLAAFPGEGA